MGFCDVANALAGQIHPVYETYLYFYSAISNEFLGCAAHNYSRNKLTLLHAALDGFVTCNAVLPSTIPLPGVSDNSTPSPASSGDFSSPSDSSEGLTTDDSLLGSITRIIDSSFEFPDEDDPFISDTEGGRGSIAFKLPVEHTDKVHLMPSPLLIRKSSSEFNSVSPSLPEPEQAKTVTRADQPARARRPPPLPIKIIPASEVKTEASQPSTAGLGELSSLMSSIDVPRHKPDITEHVTPSRAKSIVRFNSSIQFLRSQIGSSIADIQSLIEEVTELQHTRRISRTIPRSGSFWSFSPVKDQTYKANDSPKNAIRSGLAQAKETKDQRIARLRAEGWNTVGLKSRMRGWKGTEYYKAYCSSVLDEMYCL